jgi:hypothetical protein
VCASTSFDVTSSRTASLQQKTTPGTLPTPEDELRAPPEMMRSTMVPHYSASLLEGRLGAAPLQLSPSRASAAGAIQGDPVSVTTKEYNLLFAPQELGDGAASSFMMCGPGLWETAALCASDSAYPDPLILEDTSVSSSGSGNVREVSRPESSQARRQRLWNNMNKRDKKDSFDLEEEGMEMIFFQEDEEDWSAFPWSQRVVQTERVDKNIFLSFADMGFDETRPTEEAPSDEDPEESRKTETPAAHPRQTPTVPTALPQSTSAPAMTSSRLSQSPAKVSSATGNSSSSRPPVTGVPTRMTTPTRLARITSDLQALATSSSLTRASTLPAVNTPPADPIPLARTSPMASPGRLTNESISSDQVVLNQVSNVLRQVPEVWTRLTQAAASNMPPASETPILRTHSSSQVTWVSHADDFANLDGRPLTEIIIPHGAIPAVVRNTVQDIRNAIFDSIEKGEDDKDILPVTDEVTPFDQPPDAPDSPLSMSDPLALLESPSSLTMDSRFMPPLSTVPVRQPSDGEEEPGPKPADEPNSIGSTERSIARSDDVSIEDDIFTDGLPYQPQPDTPGERRSLLPPRSHTMSASTYDDEESVGLNALTSPDRNMAKRKLSGDFPRHGSLESAASQRRPPTPPRVNAARKFGLGEMLSSWDYSEQDPPDLELSSDGTSSSSENIDHLLLQQRSQQVTSGTPPTIAANTSPYDYEASDHSSILENLRGLHTLSSNELELESVVETEINEGMGIFSCAQCWDIPPLLQSRKSEGMWSRPDVSLLEDRVRSDEDFDVPKGGVGKRIVGMARSTSNAFKDIFGRRRRAAF